MAAIRRVEDVLGTGGGAEPQRHLDALRAAVQAGGEAAQRDQQILDRLVDIRSAKADDPEGTDTEAAYADASKDAGIDVAALLPAAAAEQIKARPPAAALALAVALDDWAAVRRRRRSDRAGAKRLSDAGAGSGGGLGSWRAWTSARAGDQTERSVRLTAQRAAARARGWTALGAVSLNLLGTALESSGDPAAAETVLRARGALIPATSGSTMTWRRCARNGTEA